MMRKSRAPMAFAATTNSRCAKFNVLARLILAKGGINKTPNERLTMVRLPPNMTEASNSTTKPGMASTVSMIRLKDVSIRPL